MVSTELLGVYLNDHLAGSVAGRDLAEHSCNQHEGTPYGTFLAGLARDIEQDRQALQDLMESLGIEVSTTKQAVSWVAEKLSRVKFDKRLTGSAELSRALEIEALSLGVTGKLSLWKTLKAICGADSRLDSADLDRLISRAQEQLDRLEEHRLESVAAAFVD